MPVRAFTRSPRQARYLLERVHTNTDADLGNTERAFTMDHQLPDNNQDILDVDLIDALQRRSLTSNGWPDDTVLETDGLFLNHVLDNHRLNTLLWNEEDKARRPNVPDHEIAANKRAIDGYNQRRNDAIEAMDDVILNFMALHAAPPKSDAWVNSETAGSLIDRISIGCLKIHHMALQCEREDAGEQHRQQCADKLRSLQAQRVHLLWCLRTLLDGMRSGHCTYRIYRQFKMYNDPRLNPCLYGAGVPPAGAA